METSRSTPSPVHPRRPARAGAPARDIAAASGVSLAAIGYHFGSKDALMNQAAYEAVGEWADDVQRAAAAEGTLDADPLRRFESIRAGRSSPSAARNAGSGPPSWNS